MQPIFPTTFIVAVIMSLAQPGWAQVDASGQPETATLDETTQDITPLQPQLDWKSDKLSIYFDAQHYDWKGDNDTSGNQTVFPLTAIYRYGQAEFGLKTAWIDSENTSHDIYFSPDIKLSRSGEVHTLSDTAISAAYTQPLWQQGWNIRYNLDYNAPTGKATLSESEKNAIMDGNLVQQTIFGEGHNVTPGVVITNAFSPNTVVGIGLSHTWRGSYDPSSERQHDLLDPGDETRATLQGQYATEALMLIGGLIYTKSDISTVDGQNSFRKGDRYDVNLTGIFALPYDQRITAGLRYTTQKPDSVLNYYNINKFPYFTTNFEKENHNSNVVSKYLTLEYDKTWQERHTFKVLADWLKIDANSYDQFDYLYIPKREKWQLGLGYDYQITPKSKFSIAAMYMEMRDNATPFTRGDTNYTGWYLPAGISYSF